VSKSILNASDMETLFLASDGRCVVWNVML
jgi:hypothetical protein